MVASAQQPASTPMQLMLFCGLQGSGKTTFYQQHFAATHLRISMDMLRTRRREKAILAACFGVGQRCVIDNTNPTVAERSVYIAAARENHFTIVGYYFDVPIETCLARNAVREGKARISKVGLYAVRAKLVPPALAEGFAQIYTVDGDGRAKLTAEAGG
jgi:predicted kinase